MKKCFKCEQYKELRFFYKHPQMADGYLNKCKHCAKKDVREGYRANIDHFKAYEKERLQNPERKAKAIEYQRERRKRNPGKSRARNAVSNAIRDGRLMKQACEKCGANAQAHHEDYRKPLVVRWLCRAHHLEEHEKVAF